MEKEILMRLKVELLINGINFLTEDTLKWLEQFANGSLEPTHGLFNYHDSKVFVPNEITAKYKGYSIKIETRNNKKSPYKFEIRDNKAYLIYKENKFEIEVKKNPAFLNYKSPKGFPLKKYVNIMGENCLRIYPKLYCDFDNPKYKCKYCGVNAKNDNITDEELLKEYIWAFDTAYKEYSPKYIFMSTGTHLNTDEMGFFFKFFDHIKNSLGKTGEDLLKNTVFVPAPNISLDFIDKIFETGIGMISFNLEIWDKKLFADYCPGKQHYFGHKHYIDLIKYCVEKHGIGSIKTNFVLGLEPLNSIKEGIKELAKIGCYSSGTIFYPTPGAELNESFQEKNVEYYIEIYKYINEMAEKYKLKTPWALENRISGLEWDVK